LGVYTEADVGR